MYATNRSELRDLNALQDVHRDIADLRVEITELRGDFALQIAELRADVLKWALVFLALAALAVIGLR